jgi:hypothetical protein
MTVDVRSIAEQNATPGTAPAAASARNTAQYADRSVTTGAGGEVHQTAGGGTPVLTIQQGIPVADEQNSLKIGARGPPALEDFFTFPRI